MPFDFNWHDDARSIIRVDVHGDTNWSEYHITFGQIAEAVEAVTHRVDVIINDPHGRMPQGNPLPHIKASSRKLVEHPNMGVLVVVSNRASSRLVEMLVSMAYRIYGIDTRIVGDFVRSLDEAETSIANARTKDVPR